jgi:3D (Asp-Asp-Asp) domain-containing protein
MASHYDAPKGKTAITGTDPKEGKTAAADPEFFGFPYPRGGKTKQEREQNRQVRENSQAQLKAAGISFGIPGKDLLYFEDVGGAVRGNRIDIYVEKNARTAATEYNKKYGDNVDVIAWIPYTMSCPAGSEDITNQF